MANSFDFKEASPSSSSKRKKFIIVGVIIGLLIIGLVVGLVVWLTTRNTDTPSTATPPMEHAYRIDCYPEASSPQESFDKEKCEARGCIYDPVDNSKAPACYWPKDGESQGLKVIGSEDIVNGKRWTLEVKSKSVAFTEKTISRVKFTVEGLSNDILRFKFEDADDADRFQVPVSLNIPSVELSHPRYTFSVEEDPFVFRVIRTDTNTTIWDTSSGGFSFTDQFLQISTHLPTNKVYGFGENVHNRFKHDMEFRSWPMWSRDQPPGENEDNLYGVHPFYECVEQDGKTHGVFLLNSNAMEYSFTPAPILTYRTIGGILDFYVMLGPSPENVVQQYTGLIGRPYMPPYWALGFQLSRFGFKNTTHMRQAVERTIKYDIPLDVLVSDIDYMYKRRDFTLDQDNFGDLPELITELQGGGMKGIIILDPCIEINDTYEPYLRGLEKDIYVKWPSIDVMPPGDFEEYNRTDMMGFVWPSWKVVFPDFMDPRAEEVWTDLIVKEKQKLHFDGLWVDMNEPANFGTNEEKAWNWPYGEPYWTLKCPVSKWDDPPYRPKAAYIYDNNDKRVRLSDKTVCMQGMHANGTFRHYDVHSLYGLFQTDVTLRSMRKALGDKRGMVLTRSTYPGSGKTSGRWLGDNHSSWKDLRLSIIGSLEFNLFGIPYIGADICGFFQDCPAELCKRWGQLGAFYTFSRNHNHEASMDQDPGMYGDEVAIPTREALRTRYQLLPYLYTLFHKSHTEGGTIMRPMFHEFPTDSACIDADRQFLWGPALLISPILEEKQTSIDIYFPKGRWYDYYSGKLRANNPGNMNYDVDDDSPIQLHVRGGFILPLQEPANNTQHSRTKPFSLKVALDDENGKAEGDIFWDDGDSIDTFENGNYFSAYFACSENLLRMVIQHNGVQDEMSKLFLDNIDIMGVAGANYVYVNDSTYADFTFNSDDKILSIKGLALSMSTGFTLRWSAEPATNASDFGRVNCCPDGCSETECGARECLWGPSQAPRVPWCFFDKTNHGYDVSPGNGSVYKLTRAQAPSLFGGDIENIDLMVDNKLNSMLRIKMYDPDNARFEVPIDLDLPKTTDIDNTLDFEITNERPLAFTVRRSNGGNIIWDTSLGGLTFADQYLQIAAKINCRVMHGFGEHVHPHLSHDFNYQTWPMFTRDQPPGYYGNLYGVHPFYMCVEDDGKAHGVLLVNSNAMEVMTLPDPGLVYRTIGGILDFFFIAGNSPEDVIEKYTQLIGRPYLPPYWALGFHLSRYGYNTMENLRDSLQRNIDAKVPVDVQHLDIDTLDERKDFTYDTDNFKGLPDFTNEIRAQGIKSVMILDPFLISNETDYKPYDKGLEQDVYIKWPEGVNPDFEEFQTDILLGWCWPKGRVVFPDFFHPNTSKYWEDLIVSYYNDILTFDGIWLDMNDPANFDTNNDRAFNWPEDALPWWTLKCPNSSLDDPPYKPKSIWGDRLSDKTICMNTLQAEGMFNHYDVHNLYGWSQTPSTATGVQRATKHRGLTVSRSTYPGSGKHAGHWLGDNASTWPDLKRSIVGMIEFNLFGIPYVGADICGYFNDADVDLCQRWQQLGAFYTFSRNHQGKGNKDQDPAHYGGEMLASTKRVLEIRYSLLPYLYSQFFHVHISGGTVIKSLLHEFPTGDKEIEIIDRQFMYGPALMVSPVLEKDVVKVRAYFPEGRWYDYHTNVEVKGSGMYHELIAPMDLIPLHIRGGYIMVTQHPEVNTQLSRKNPFGLVIAPNEKNEASVTFVWDDGESIDTYKNGNYYSASISYTSTGVKINIDTDHESMGELTLGHVKVLGFEQKPSSVKANTQNVEDFHYFSTSKTLLVNVEDLNISMRSNVNIEFQV